MPAYPVLDREAWTPRVVALHMQGKSIRDGAAALGISRNAFFLILKAHKERTDVLPVRDWS